MSDSESVIERYAAGSALLTYAVADLTPDQEAAHPGPGAWSIAELVVHLLDSDLVLGDRMKRVIAEENPPLQAFDENAWLTRLDSHSMPIEEAVNLFAAHRHWMTRILRKCSEADFARTGQHTERGRQTLAEVLASAIRHLDHHLQFLYSKRANLGVALPPRYTAT